MKFINLIRELEGGMDSKLYTLAELAREFKVSRQTIHNWVKKEGRFPNYFEVGEGGGKIILVPTSDVDAVKKEEAEKLIEELNRLGFQAVPA